MAKTEKICNEFFWRRFSNPKRKSALNDFTRQYVIDGEEGYSPKDFLGAAKPKIVEKLKENKQTKTKLILTCDMERADIASGEVFQDESAFHSQIEENLEADDENEIFEEMRDRILENIANFQMQGSNWRFVKVEKLELHFVDYFPLKGSSWIPLPSDLAARKAIVNPKNPDNFCFLWAITIAENTPENHPERIGNETKKQSEKYNINGINFPMNFKNIDKFENQNKHLAVNVFGYSKEIYPLRISKKKNTKKKNLLYLTKKENTGVKTHFCWIKNLDKLLSMQVSNHKESKVFL